MVHYDTIYVNNLTELSVRLAGDLHENYWSTSIPWLCDCADIDLHTKVTYYFMTRGFVPVLAFGCIVCDRLRSN